MLTKQETFDKVAVHLIQQGVRSTFSDQGGLCLYRGPNGRKCAAGALIADEHYANYLEGETVSGSAVALALVASGVDMSNQGIRGLVEVLQRDVHDPGHDPGCWPDLLREVASRFDLNTDALEAAVATKGGAS